MSPKNITDHRIYGLDFLKYICCLFVIFIHMEFPSTVEVIILPLTRVAVPCFFMITGYFYEQTCKKDEGKKQIKKVIGFTLCANMLHLGWSFCKVALASESFAEYAKTLFSKENLVNLLLFHQPPYRVSLWYINGLLVLLLLVLLLQKWESCLKKFYVLIPLLMAGNLVFGTYSFVFCNMEVPLQYTRNAVFCGLPCFLLGDCFKHKKVHFKNVWLVFGTLVFAVCSVGESWILHHHNVMNSDFLLSTPFFAAFVFLWFLQNESRLAKSNIVIFIAGLGAKYSFIIYIIHSILIEFWSKGMELILLPPLFADTLLYVSPLAILMFSTMMAVIWDKTTNWFKKKFEV